MFGLNKKLHCDFETIEVYFILFWLAKVTKLEKYTEYLWHLF